MVTSKEFGQPWCVLNSYVLFILPLRQGFDIQKDAIFNDLTGSLGMMTGLRNVLRLQRKALLFIGLPCNSHSFMSSSQHQRSCLQPYGQESFEFVSIGNTIALRSAALILIALVRGAIWFLENPGGSKCLCLPVLRNLLTFRHLGSMYTRW